MSVFLLPYFLRHSIIEDMCGRYALYNTNLVPKRFGTRPPPESLELRDNYNVAPGQMLPVIIQTDHEKSVEIMKWGLIPSWAKEPGIGYRMINARAEGIFDKPAWRGPIRHHRCLVPASGFYEWRVQPGQTDKQPYYIFPKGEEMFAFAGMYDTWHRGNEDEIQSYAIITTQPNEEMAILHDRMPVILHPDNWELWIDPGVDSRGMLEELLRPYNDNTLDMYEVSTDVNAVKNNDEYLLYPLNPV